MKQKKISNHRVSVVVPAYNSEDTIERCLEFLINQNYRNYEIIVVDDGSKDNTAKVVEKYMRRHKKIKLIKQKNSGPAAARNRGAKKARGRIILFTDSDCLADKNWIKNMVEPFSDKNVAGVSGTYRTLNKEKLIARFVGYEIEKRHEKMAKSETIDFIGTFSAGYLKNIFFKFGGFDTKFRKASGEDPELSFRIAKAGYKLIFNKKAFVYHPHVDNLKSYLKQKFYRAYWRVLLYRKHPEKMAGDSYTSSNLLMGTVFSGFFLLFLMLGFVNKIFFSASALFLVASILLNADLYLFLLKKELKAGVAAIPITLLTYFAYGFGVLWGLFKLRKLL